MILFLRTSGTYLSPSLIFYKHKRVVTIVTLTSVTADSVLSVSEKLVYRVPLLALCWLACVSNMFHASISFASCNRSDPSVLVARKWCGQTEILANTGTQMKKTQLLKNNGAYYATFICSQETYITTASPETAS